MSQSDPLDRWRGEFGDSYIARNPATQTEIDKKCTAFAKILHGVENPRPASILEVGCNIGINLEALRTLSDATLYGLEPNPTARAALLERNIIPRGNLFESSAQQIPLPDNGVDLSFTWGVLIHIPEAHFNAALDEIHRVSKRYILCAEYFSRDPQIIRYHGQDDMLFKRDFGGAYLDRFKDLEPVADGFFWRRTTGLDDITWCLLQKTA